MIGFQGKMGHEEKLAKLIKILYDQLASELEKEEWCDLELTEVAAWLCTMSFKAQPNTPLRQKQVKYAIKMLQEIVKD